MEQYCKKWKIWIGTLKRKHYIVKLCVQVKKIYCNIEYHNVSFNSKRYLLLFNLENHIFWY